MTTYDATATCHNLRCTVVTYAYDQSEHDTVPECPACALRALVRAQRAAALREAAEALREADRAGYVHLRGERVPWEPVARWLDDRAEAEGRADD